MAIWFYWLRIDVQSRTAPHILTELTKPQRQILKALDIPILEQSVAWL